MPDREPTQIPQHFVFALVEDFSHMAFSCAVDPLRIANLISEKELYTWSFASLDGKTATSSNTSVTLAHNTFKDIPPLRPSICSIRHQHAAYGSHRSCEDPAPD